MLKNMWLRGLVVAAALALALGAAGCGGSDDGDDRAEGGAEAAERDASPDAGDPDALPEGASPEEQVRALAAAVQKAGAEGRGDFVCPRLTSASRRQVASTVADGKGRGTCEQAFAEFAETRVKSVALPKITGVDVRGGEAAVTFADEKGYEYQLAVVKQDGEWKVDYRSGETRKAETAPGGPGRAK